MLLRNSSDLPMGSGTDWKVDMGHQISRQVTLPSRIGCSLTHQTMWLCMYGRNPSSSEKCLTSYDV